MKKYLLPFSIALGVIFDIFFWKKMPGISFPLFTAICLTGGYTLISQSGNKPAKVNYLLLIPLSIFTIMTVFRREPLTSFLNYSLTLFVMALLAASYLQDAWTKFNLVDYISVFFHLIGGMIALPWMQKDSSSVNETDKGKKRNLAPILRGLALSLPIWLIFIALLYSADLIFAGRIDNLLANLNLDNVVELTVQLILALLVAYFFSGAVLFAAQRSDRPVQSSTEKPLIPPFLGLTETGIILGGVILLFGSFVILQFQYFFSGQANITLDGFTYAEYARKGFGELVGVAVLSIILLKGLSIFTKKEDENDHRLFTLLSAGLVALVLVILTSAFQRLFLYESAYGFTRLRTYAHIFMVWLGIYLFSILVMEILKRGHQFINVSLLVMAGFSLSLGILNVDRFIVNRNIGRSIRGEPFDSGYLATLSSDAVPAMVEQFSNDRLPVDLQEGIGAALVCYQQMPFNQSLGKRPWQSFHFSDRAAISALDQVSGDLKGYRVDSEAWPIVVTSPRGVWYPCQSSSGMD